MILGQKAHDEAVEKIESWKRGEKKYSDKELWEARNIIESMEHPQTKQIINPIGRMSCFVPANIPIQIGMLLAPPTVSVAWSIKLDFQHHSLAVDQPVVQRHLQLQ